ncbi:MAG: GntP family permease, partial [Verrucomicrobiota bacterium]
MDPLWIVLSGTVVMVLGLLAFRLHAFLALILGALVVGLLTPESSRAWQMLRGRAARVEQWDPASGVARVPPRVGWRAGSVELVPEISGPPEARFHARWEIIAGSPPGTGRIAGVPEGQSASGRWWIAPVGSAAEAVQQARGHPLGFVADGFGTTCKNIGFLILLASVIGRCLSESRAADRVVRWIQETLGENRAPQGFAVSGFLLGIPSFFDTVFYLLMPLGRGLAERTGRDFLLYTLTIVAGATMAHGLVPPTPGPLFAATEFGVPLGGMMLGGIVVGAVSVSSGLVYASWANRRWSLPLRPLGDAAPAPAAAPAEEGMPALGWSVLPILLPIGLIAASEVGKASGLTAGWGVWGRWIGFFGQSQMALLTGTAVALVLFASRRRWNWAALSGPVSQAMAGGGTILMITAAGGAFGQMIRQTDIATRLVGLAGTGHFALLLAAFGITSLVRIAQGSATVAIITASGVVAPIAAAA